MSNGHRDAANFLAFLSCVDLYLKVGFALSFNFILFYFIFIFVFSIFHKILVTILLFYQKRMKV